MQQYKRVVWCVRRERVCVYCGRMPACVILCACACVCACVCMGHVGHRTWRTLLNSWYSMNPLPFTDTSELSSHLWNKLVILVYLRSFSRGPWNIPRLPLEVPNSSSWAARIFS